MIHQTAIVDASARIAEDVEIGPYSVIGPEVEIGAATVVGPHAVIMGPCKIGCQNRIFQFSSIGEAPQDKKYQGEPTSLELGARKPVALPDRIVCILDREVGQRSIRPAGARCIKCTEFPQHDTE